MIIAMIAAVAKNWEIGKDNKLLWHIPEDLKRFKEITNRHTVIMGQKTYESLPVHPLPNRTNIVVSNDDDWSPNDAVVVRSIEESLIEASRYSDDGEVFVIGGGSIYNQFLPISEKIYLTRINKSFEADTFFPTLDFKNWKEIFREDRKNDEFEYSFLIYEKI